MLPDGSSHFCFNCVGKFQCKLFCAKTIQELKDSNIKLEAKLLSPLGHVEYRKWEDHEEAIVHGIESQIGHMTMCDFCVDHYTKQANEYASNSEGEDEGQYKTVDAGDIHEEDAAETEGEIKPPYSFDVSWKDISFYLIT
jgi:hypothetical protein